MRRRFSKADHTTGKTGVLCVVVIASTCGAMWQPSSCQMVATAGSDSSSMESWQPCTPAEALRAGRIVRVSFSILSGILLYRIKYQIVLYRVKYQILLYRIKYQIVVYRIKYQILVYRIKYQTLLYRIKYQTLLYRIKYQIVVHLYRIKYQILVYRIKCQILLYE